METEHILANFHKIKIYFDHFLNLTNPLVPEEKRRFGGFLTIMDNETGLVLSVIPLGEIPVEKMERYLTLSQEKARRLFNHPEHIASRQSQNPDNLKFPGAIRGKECLYSFSGCIASCDEAFSVACFYILEPSDKKLEKSEVPKIKQVFQGLRDYFNSLEVRNDFVYKAILSAREIFGKNSYLDPEENWND